MSTDFNPGQRNFLAADGGPCLRPLLEGTRQDGQIRLPARHAHWGPMLARSVRQTSRIRGRTDLTVRPFLCGPGCRDQRSSGWAWRKPAHSWSAETCSVHSANCSIRRRSVIRIWHRGASDGRVPEWPDLKFRSMLNGNVPTIDYAVWRRHGHRRHSWDG